MGRYPRSRAAHPRSRGENHYEYARHETIKGSSPLTRGKPYGPGARGFGGGLIPAHAGKTNQEGEKRTLRGAHPRSRGENVLRAILAIVSAGSSPLTRGKPASHPRPWQLLGLIPAHAGKTNRKVVQKWHTRAHPRSRGENRVTFLCLGAVWGSSPLTRGKHPHARTRSYADGLIPAHAGKTLRQGN